MPGAGDEVLNDKGTHLYAAGKSAYTTEFPHCDFFLLQFLYVSLPHEKQAL